MPEQAKKILVIRRDNIGDLVCTTPLLLGLRQRYPDAHIAVLVNSYNAAVLSDHPAVDEVFVYEKAKHREAHRSRWSVYLGTVLTMLKLRRHYWDRVYLAGSAYSARAAEFVSWLRCQNVIGYAPVNGKDKRITHRFEGEIADFHHVEAVYRLGLHDGIPQTIPPMLIRSVPAVRQQLQSLLPTRVGKTLGIHISARKTCQRWPVSQWVELIRQVLQASPDLSILLFWSPGAEDNPRHPGDDAKAYRILQEVGSANVQPLVTTKLEQLVAGLDLCDYVLCSDGGAMHIAAALGKPIVCLFGQTPAQTWHPWGVPHRLLQPESCDVIDIRMEQVLDAVVSLLAIKADDHDCPLRSADVTALFNAGDVLLESPHA
ncbi:glycosyltransferase family 9 protein [Pokkaliibacter plantistimulans]|uniref:glycosyltransferase family 9 protein n=1 Tax=Pokkaliibacter plantistimulans TaxID=1635171 RepID=UPI000D744800|nr:glycosyltransferase family 9 protein [Pokkaliibacter plantistimulans]